MKDMKGKPSVAVMIALGAKKKFGKEEPDQENEDLSVVSARELLDAIKDDDQDKFASLLKDFIHACCDESPDDDEGD